MIARAPLATLIAASAVFCALVPATASAATYTGSNTGLITIPDSGAASPFPSKINLPDARGLITDVNVTLTNVGHGHPDDLDILLVSPRGTATVLMSDSCGATDIEDRTWTFDDEAPAAMPDQPAGACTEPSYKPSENEAGDTWPVAGTPGTTMSNFDEENPSGEWRLYVTDDSGGEQGDIEGGWSLTVTTAPTTADIPATGSDGIAGPYPLTQTVTGKTGTISDLNITLSGMTHAHPDDLDIVVQGPGGQTAMLMSDACGEFDVVNYFWKFDDEAAGFMPDNGTANICANFAYKPTDRDSGSDTFPGGGPAGPHPASLAAFDGTDPNGTWKFFIVDDSALDSGFLINPPTLEITTNPPANPGTGGGASTGSGAPVNTSGGGNTTKLVDRSGPVFAFISKALKLDRKGRVAVSLRGPTNETGPSSASLTLTTTGKVNASARKKLTLGKLKTTLRPNAPKKVYLKVSRRNARVIRRLKKVGTTLKVTVTDASGNKKTVSKRLTLRP